MLLNQECISLRAEKTGSLSRGTFSPCHLGDGKPSIITYFFLRKLVLLHFKSITHPLVSCYTYCLAQAGKYLSVCRNH